MKIIASALIALGFLVGAAQAAPVAKTQTDTVAEWGSSSKCYRCH